MTDHHECHMKHVKLLSEISCWKGLAKELHEMLCDATECNFPDDDVVTPERYDEIMKRVNEEWDD